MSARESPKPKRLPFDLPIAKVRPTRRFLELCATVYLHVADANLFKDAFVNAQQENEALFKDG